MADLLNDVINYIITGGKASCKDVDIFKDFEPDSPDNAIIVSEYEGSAPAPFTAMSVRSVQVVCRSKQNAVAKETSWGIYNLLHKPDLFITLGDRKCIITMRNTPIKIGIDSSNRIRWGFNIALTTNLD